MPTGLVALLDDISVIAKVAAASIDDVGAAAAKAGTKAAGVVIDDTAVTPRYVIGLAGQGGTGESSTVSSSETLVVLDNADVFNTGLYALLFVLLNLEAWSLLIGSVLLGLGSVARRCMV